MLHMHGRKDQRDTGMYAQLLRNVHQRVEDLEQHVPNMPQANRRERLLHSHGQTRLLQSARRDVQEPLSDHRKGRQEEEEEW